MVCAKIFKSGIATCIKRWESVYYWKQLADVLFLCCYFYLYLYMYFNKQQNGRRLINAKRAPLGIL